MPVFALAYGSFGDILATVQLAIKIAIFLRQSGSPSIECAETEKELKLLGSDLDLTHLTLQQMSASPLRPFITKRIEDEVVRCHLIMYRFFAKVTASQGLLQKIWWAAFQEKELAAFRMQVIERRTALSFVVELITSGALMAVRDRVDEVGGQVSYGHNLIRDVHDGLLQQITAYQEQIVAVICNVSRGVSEAMFVVVSPTGISIPISVTYCNSYKVLDRILKTYMHQQRDAGGRYVERGDYNIVSPTGDIIRPPKFPAILRVGVCLEMSIVKRDHVGSRNSCPQCGRSSGTSTDIGWNTCRNLNCGSRYQILGDDVDSVDVVSDKAVYFPALSQMAGGDSTYDEEDEDHTTLFRLIQVVSIQDKLPRPHKFFFFDAPSPDETKPKRASHKRKPNPPPAPSSPSSSADMPSSDAAPAQPHIPRPPNAFILFRSSFLRARAVPAHIEPSHAALSAIAGLTWAALPAPEKERWHSKAKEERKRHLEQFPGYAFRPRGRGKEAGRTSTAKEAKDTGTSATDDEGGGGGGEDSKESKPQPPPRRRQQRECPPLDRARQAYIASLILSGLSGAQLQEATAQFDRERRERGEGGVEVRWGGVETPEGRVAEAADKEKIAAAM